MHFEDNLFFEKFLMYPQQVPKQPHNHHLQLSIISKEVNILILIRIGFIFDPILYLFKPIIFTIFCGYNLGHFLHKVLVLFVSFPIAKVIKH